jgi:hypothetical protein
MHRIKEKLMDELHEVEEKLLKASGEKLSAGDLEYIHKLTDTIKNIDKIEMLEEDGGHSQNGGNWMARGMYGGNSYDDGGNSYARRKRDSMGRYSRNGGSSYEMDGERGRRGGYSRDGYSRADAKEEMAERMEEMMDMAESEKEKEIIRQAISKIRNV